MPECVKCGNMLRDGAKFCAKCGSRQDEGRSTAAAADELTHRQPVATDPQSCPKCGKTLLAGSQSCWACGAPLKTDRPLSLQSPSLGMPPLPTIETPDSLARRTPLIAVGAIVFLAGALLLAFYLLIHRSGQQPTPSPLSVSDQSPTNAPAGARPHSATTSSEPSPSRDGAASHLTDERTTLAGIHFQVLRNGASSRRYLLIHGNEYTAREVVRSYVQTHSGTALLIVGTERFVTWDNATLDPNRLFSREGAERNLRRLNGSHIVSVLPQILDRLDAERQALVAAITPQPGGLIVAPHNTSQHSVHDEIPLSNSYELGDPSDSYSFYLCTDPNDYRSLAASGFNAVLQNQPHGDDDGSLSRLAARLGIRYLNIETPLGQFAKQTKMIAWADANLP